MGGLAKGKAFFVYGGGRGGTFSARFTIFLASAGAYRYAIRSNKKGRTD